MTGPDNSEPEPTDRPRDRADDPEPDEAADHARELLERIPVRRFRSADADDESRTTGPPRDAPLRPADGPRPRAWNWVPLGALLTLPIVMLASYLTLLLLPEAEASIEAFTEAMSGVEGDAQQMEAMEAIFDGPDGEAVVRTFAGLFVASLAALILSGMLVAYAGRTRPLEAGLATGTFAGGLAVVSGGAGALLFPTFGFAFAAGLLGGWIGSRIRRGRDARRARR